MELNELIYADRSERGKLCFTGPQRAWFLHQIMTNDFENLAPGEHRDAALLTAHGRMVGYLEAVADESAIWTHFEPELQSSLPEAIHRYVFATQVDIADVTADYGLVLVAGSGWYDLAGAAAPRGLRHPTQSLGTPAGYVWVERGGTQDLLDALKRSARAAEEDELEEIRIARGVARWGRDMNEKTIPQEARIEGTAVHFDKGCYVGQEAMAKIHFRGKVNRRLRTLEASGHLPVGSDVMLDGSKVGTITSSSRGRALGILRYTVEPGSVVDVGGERAKVIA